MWQPDPAWQPLAGGSGTSTIGVWRIANRQRSVLVKRLAPPPDWDVDRADALRPGSLAYWRREADVSIAGVVEATPGLRGPTTAVEEDDEGITLFSDWVEAVEPEAMFAATNLGRFAGAELGSPGWLGDAGLRERLARVEQRGGWSTLARTAVADLADHLWRHRLERLAELDALPTVVQHGDPAPTNLRGRTDDAVLAIDWGPLGRGPVGGDLGCLALTTRHDFEPLLTAYVAGLGEAPHLATVTAEQVGRGAAVTAAYLALSRAEWALARAAAGEGALAGKFTHPSVAPHLRTLQRLYPQIESIL